MVANVSAGSLERMLETPAGSTANKPSPAGNSITFEDQLRALLAESLSRLGIDPSRVQVNVQVQPSLAEAASSAPRPNSATGGQVLVTVEPKAAAQSSDPWAPFHQKSAGLNHLVPPLLPDPSYGKQASQQEAPNLAAADPLAMVREELAKQGIPPESIKMALWDDIINNIGGNYTNHLIRAQLPNGHIEDFSVELTIRNPTVTAVEIKRLLSMAPPQYPVHLPGYGPDLNSIES